MCPRGGRGAPKHILLRATKRLRPALDWITDTASPWFNGRVTRLCVFKTVRKRTEVGHTGSRMTNSIWSCTVKIKSASKFSNGLSEVPRRSLLLEKHTYTDVNIIVQFLIKGMWGKGIRHVSQNLD